MTSREVRTLDAIHLSTALYIEADEFIANDRRLLAAAEAQGGRGRRSRHQPGLPTLNRASN